MSALLDSLLDDDALRNASAPQRAAAQALRRDGLPQPRDEAWKYTSLRALEQRRYADGDDDAATRTVDAQAFDLPGVDGLRLVFINGVFRADLSRMRAVAGLTITPSAGVATIDESARGAAARAAGFARLNAALATGGLRIEVAADARIAESIHLVFAGAPAKTDVAWQARLRVQLGERSTLHVIEHHASAGANAHLGNLVADYTLAGGARLDLLQVEAAAEASSLVRHDAFEIADDAVLCVHALQAGAQWMRHGIEVDLAGARARVESRGVFALRGRQHCDTHLDVHHRARDTCSDVVWRGVADDRARGVLHGAIVIASGADGADAQLRNKNLLLSPSAEIDTQPVLEIHADEVKAAHGATVGQLDERALFYLRSRGIALADARQVLVSGFCREMFARIEPPALREHLDAIISARLSIDRAA